MHRLGVSGDWNFRGRNEYRPWRPWYPCHALQRCMAHSWKTWRHWLGSERRLWVGLAEGTWIPLRWPIHGHFEQFWPLHAELIRHGQCGRCLNVRTQFCRRPKAQLRRCYHKALPAWGRDAVFSDRLKNRIWLLRCQVGQNPLKLLLEVADLGRSSRSVSVLRYLPESVCWRDSNWEVYL